jgi:DNA-nicking Smr family endonuclease
MEEPNSLPTLDLHRRTWAEAERQVRHALLTWRRRGFELALIVTGRGWGNPRQEPILRTKVERWLDAEEARSLGVKGWRRVSRDGALEVRLARSGGARRREPRQ